jgi:hypothetical protein
MNRISIGILFTALVGGYASPSVAQSLPRPTIEEKEASDDACAMTMALCYESDSDDNDPKFVKRLKDYPERCRYNNACSYTKKDLRRLPKIASRLKCIDIVQPERRPDPADSEPPAWLAPPAPVPPSTPKSISDDACAMVMAIAADRWADEKDPEFLERMGNWPEQCTFNSACRYTKGALGKFPKINKRIKCVDYVEPQ